MSRKGTAAAKTTSTSSIGDDVRAAHQGELYGIPYDATQGKFDPHSSHMADDVLNKFLQAPLSGDLADVPGISEKNKEHFMNLSKETNGKFQNIPNSWQLIGEYLRLKEDGMSGVDLCNKFWHWLKLVGINSGRNHIVRSIAEKCELVEGFNAANYKHSSKIDEETLAGIPHSDSK